MSRFERVSSVWRARVDRLGGQFVFQHSESFSFLSRGTAQHELLHLGQYLRNPGISERGIAYYFHEYTTSLFGPVLPHALAVHLAHAGVAALLYGEYRWHGDYKNLRKSRQLEKRMEEKLRKRR